MLESPEPGVDQALAAALPSADDATRRRIVEVLLQRGDPTALRTLILQFEPLPPDVQHQVVESADTLYRPLREATRLAEGRKAALEIIRRCGDPKLAYLAASLLRDRDEAVRADAGVCLIELARQAATDHHPGVNWRVDAHGAGELIHSVEEVIQHNTPDRHEAALVAAMWLLPRPMPVLGRTLSDSTQPATSALRRMLEMQSRDELVRGVLWLLSVPPLSATALDVLADRLDRGAYAEVFEQRAMLLLPGGVETLRRARRLARPLEKMPMRGDLPADAAAGLLKLADVVPLESTARLELLRRAARHQEPAVRVLAVRRLAAEAGASGEADAAREAARHTLAELSEDEDEAVARAAATAWLRRREAMPLRPLASLVVNRHASVRALAARRLGPMGFDRLWRVWPGLDAERRFAAAEALIRIDAGFHNALGDRLVADDKATRLQAMDMIAELGQGQRFEHVLTRLARCKDPQLAAAAVRAMGSAETEAGHRVVAEAVRSDVPEVRAQAVAALSPEEASRCADELLQMARDEAPAPRAAAIRVLLGHSAAEAQRALRDMLADSRPGHRSRAVQLAGEIGLITLAPTIAEIAVSDPDPAVRSTAWETVGRLIAGMTEHVSVGDEKSDDARPAAPAAGSEDAPPGELDARWSDSLAALGSIRS